jgi:dTDP-4-dehydrorhamnose reductase
MPKKILIFGSNGNVGRSLNGGLKARGHEVKSLNRNDYDIRRSDNRHLHELLSKRWDVVINCTAFIGIKACEMSRKEAIDVNYAFLRDVATIITRGRHQPYFIHFSTDNVFQCESPDEVHLESSKACPTTWYGVSKLLGETAVSTIPKALIVRLPLLFSSDIQNSQLTINKLLRDILHSKKIIAYNDVFNTPLLVEIVEQKINDLISAESPTVGVLHLTTSDYMSLYELLTKLGSAAGISSDYIEGISFGQKDGSALKPRFGGLASEIDDTIPFDFMLKHLKRSL